MNRVERLIETPFSQLTTERKMEIKRLGPYQPKSCPLVQVCGKTRRTLRSSWYEKAEWLCYGETLDALFCFYCLLFSTEDSSPWTKAGVRDLKHLSQKIKTHSICDMHLHSAVKYKMFGSTTNIMSQLDDGYNRSVVRRNEKIAKNRHVLNRVIDALKFLGIHELPLRGNDESEMSSNRGAFLDLLEYTASMDEKLRDHLSNATVARNTSKDIQNDLLDSIYEIYLAQIESEISSCEFVSIQSDETTDVTCASQLAVVLRYVKCGRPVERFHSFVNVKDRSAAGISEILQNILRLYDVREKLIAQTYDGAAVMSGSRNGVQALIKREYPHAHFLHCYAHQLNLVVKRMCYDISLTRIFFANVSGFSSFFAYSSKRTDLLKDVCKRALPHCASTRWNFQSRVVRSVKENHQELLTCFSEIESTPTWDDITIREAQGLKRLLIDSEFCFFLDFFADVFVRVDILYNAFQSHLIDGATAESHVSEFCDALSYIRQNISFKGDEGSLRRGKTGLILTSAARECCDVLAIHLTDRLRSKHLATFSLLHPPKFAEYNKHFPRNLLASASDFFPMIPTKQLELELRCMYSNPKFSSAGTALNLFQILRNISLTKTFPAVSQLCNIILTTPISSADSERCFSTLKRIKTFSRNRMGQDRLNALAVLSIHKDEIKTIQSFNDLVIERFAAKKTRRAEYLFIR